MRVVIRKTYEEMSVATAGIILDQVARKPNSLLCFPSGDSPTGTLSILVDKIRSGNADISQCKFVGLDEWVGMDRFDTGSCQHYMYEKFFNPAEIRNDQITFFDAKSPDLKTECNKVDRFIAQHSGIDLIVVGIGLNGHLGLNEPGSPFSNYCHVVGLEESTKISARKYFDKNTILSHGITLGLKHISMAKSTIVIAGGEKKSAIIQKIIEGPITEQVPGSIMQTLEHGLIILDELAASRLTISA
jgi:glucosamine-6-phosphate deaminase